MVAPGCLDMVNFGPPESVPAKFKGRRFYQHNPQVTLMRTTPEECRELGRLIAGKLNASTGPVSLMIPMKGISVISAPGQPFHDAAADAALFDALKGIPVTVLRAENSDLLSAATVDIMKDRHPGLAAYVIRDRGHVPFLDEPEARAAIKAWLEIV